jgi:retron-type reverse transcriptase
MKKILQIQKSKSGVDTREKLISFLGVKKEKFEECFKVIPLLYELTPIPKKNNAGYRKLSIPKQELRDIQRCVLDKIFVGIKLPSCVYGFSSGKSIIDNAKYHSKSDYLLNLDIKDFFPSVHFERVMQIFRDLGFNDPISEILCILTTYNHQLPQGAPTSPLIASLVLNNLDRRLTKLAETNHVLYSRYFDDISFSGSKRILAIEETCIKMEK